METFARTADGQALWHLYWQAATGRDLLVDTLLFPRIRGRVIAAHEPCGRSLLHYLVMPTELHLLAGLADGESPLLIAREIASLVARWVREVDGIRGPVFASRYQAHRISSMQALSDKIRMLAWRPVAMQLCTRPTYYSMASLRSTLGLCLARDFDARPLLELFSAKVPEARQAIRDTVRGRPSALELRAWELNHGLVLARGPAGSMSPTSREVRGPAATLIAAAEQQGIEGALVLLERWVAAKMRLAPSSGLATLGGIAGARARALVAGLAVQVGLCSAAAVARRYRRAKATLCEQMTASRQRLADRVLLATPVEQIIEEVQAMEMASSATE